MGRCCKLVKLVSIVLVGWLGYNVYLMFQIPPLPNLPLDQYWGPGKLKKAIDTSIRPFKVEWKPEMITDLKERLGQTRFTTPYEGVGFQYGFNGEFLKVVVNFWKNQYNFPEREKYLNSFPQFKTNIQGLDIHFIHIVPKKTNNLKVIPLLLLHGWPGSVVEFYKMIPSLVTPKPGKDFVFEVIAPSLPGFGYSQGASKTGLGDAQIAVVMKNLMNRLNHKKFIVQGGDWGSAIGAYMATLFPDSLIGYHSNMAVAGTMMSYVYQMIGSIYPPFIVEKKFEYKMYPLSKLFNTIMEEAGYFHIQSTKPDTVGAALVDSPAGLAAYILEKFSFWTNQDYTTLEDGGIVKKFTMTELLDNVMVYWDSGSITSSMRIYAESVNKKQMALGLDYIPTEVPTAIARFENELIFQTECQYKTKFHNIVQITDFFEGGHFAAFEVPELLSNDIWQASAKFFEFHKKQQNQKKEL